MVFKDYSKYYDHLYFNKNYSQEVEYITSLFDSYKLGIKTILDIGCGTGEHAIRLAKKGFSVYGIDYSESMLAIARNKAQKTTGEIKFDIADLRYLNLNQTFNAVISMFAVMCYQTSNDDLFSAFSSIRRHLLVDGIFLFDGWFGPAVLSQQPSDRMKSILAEGARVIRFAHSVTDILSNTVRVNYSLIKLKDDRVIEEISETHLMRYLFPSEIALFAKKTGFEVIDIHPFMKPGQIPTEMDWNVTWVLRAV